MQEPDVPTALHKEAIAAVFGFFEMSNKVDTILLTNSCARGKATPESDIDFAILVKGATPRSEIKELKKEWNLFLCTEPALLKFTGSHRFAHIHLDMIEGIYRPEVWDDGGGPDSFEVEIGNHLLYSLPLGNKGTRFRRLQQKWLPYYRTGLQVARLTMVKEACSYDLDHIPFYVKRGLYFQAFDRLVKAHKEFLQALFIRHKTYPIAYNKWIKEQVAGILKLPQLYKELPPALSIAELESNELTKKAAWVQKLLDEYC